MAGSHRAPVQPRGPGAARLLVLALLLVAAGAGVYALNRGHDDPNASDNRTGLPFPTPTSLPTVTFTPSPSPTVRKPTQKAKPLPRVAPSPPRRLVVPGVIDIGFDDVVAPRNGVFTAASTTEAARWGGRGVPGSPSSDTVYLIGKVSASGAFARLPSLHRGTRITVRTQTGVLTYTVQAVDEKPAQGLTKDAAFTEAHRGRLQLVGIRYAGSARTGTILVVTAQLTGARRT